MRFHPGQLVEYTGIEGRNMSILSGGELIRDCHVALHGELFLFIRPWDSLSSQPEWGVFLVGERYVVERCHCFYPLKPQA